MEGFRRPNVAKTLTEQQILSLVKETFEELQIEYTEIAGDFDYRLCLPTLLEKSEEELSTTVFRMDTVSLKKRKYFRTSVVPNMQMVRIDSVCTSSPPSKLNEYADIYYSPAA